MQYFQLFGIIIFFPKFLVPFLMELILFFVYINYS